MIGMIMRLNHSLFTISNTNSEKLAAATISVSIKCVSRQKVKNYKKQEFYIA